MNNKGKDNLFIDIEELLHLFSQMEDFHYQKLNNYDCLYLKTLIDKDHLNKFIISPLLDTNPLPINQKVNVGDITLLDGVENAKNDILIGNVVVYDKQLKQIWSIPIPSNLGRSVEPSEQETVVYGSNESFTEQIVQNITLLRRYLPISQLKSESFHVGYLSKNRVSLLYLEEITNKNVVEKVRQRIKEVDFDTFVNSSTFSNFLEDQPFSLFPQFRLTDRPDTAADALSNGQVVIIVNKTPFVVIGPTTFFQQFQSTEDYILRWPVSSFIRLIRLLAYITTLMLLPFYVSIITYHYEALPIELLFLITDSRTDVPFSPFWEALLMIITMEFLKEASKRMPTKTGQTLGIVGGIIIGEAAVQAGIASNFLIVAVGITAVTSFLVPNYIMGTTTKLLRIILLIVAIYWGFFGLFIGTAMIVIHLNGVTSLGVNYLSPIAPITIKDWKETVFRFPIQFINRRPEFLHPQKHFKTKKSKV